MTEPKVYYNCSEDIAAAYTRSLERHIALVRQAAEMFRLDVPHIADHDLSKFGPEEFVGYARHFHGGGDPDGFAAAWLHHIHHNPHHWQHWLFADGYSPPDAASVVKGALRMPEVFVREMVADWLGASMSYTGSWSMTKWLASNMPKIRLHPESAAYLRRTLANIGYADVVFSYQFAHEVQQ